MSVAVCLVLCRFAVAPLRASGADALDSNGHCAAVRGLDERAQHALNRGLAGLATDFGYRNDHYAHRDYLRCWPRPMAAT